MYKHIASHFIPGIAEVLVVERLYPWTFQLEGTWKVMDDESLPHIAIYFIPWDLFRVDIPLHPF